VYTTTGLSAAVAGGSAWTHIHTHTHTLYWHQPSKASEPRGKPRHLPPQC